MTHSLIGKGDTSVCLHAEASQLPGISYSQRNNTIHHGTPWREAGRGGGMYTMSTARDEP